MFLGYIENLMELERPLAKKFLEYLRLSSVKESLKLLTILTFSSKLVVLENRLK